MPRAARVVVPGVSHHITQRGNNQQDIFFTEDDRGVYLDLLHQQSERFGFVVEGYCLMPNHVHVVGVPRETTSLAKAIGRTHFLYTQYVNKFHERSGHLWQNRFYSCPMDEDHALRALAYVELNPVRAEMVTAAEDYAWSSAAAHVGKDSDNAYLDLRKWRESHSSSNWRATLIEIAGNETIATKLRSTTHTGRPLGTDSFMSKIETLLNRRVRALPVGRQKGWRKKKVDDPDK